MKSTINCQLKYERHYYLSDSLSTWSILVTSLKDHDVEKKTISGKTIKL